jgi:Kef-type K+ transport system membrane component KefB
LSPSTISSIEIILSVLIFLLLIYLRRPVHRVFEAFPKADPAHLFLASCVFSIFVAMMILTIS